MTLVTERAVIADALAKGVFILGPTEGMALIERMAAFASRVVASMPIVLPFSRPFSANNSSTQRNTA